MGSVISKIYDDYEDYEFFCKEAGVKPLDIMDLQWRQHFHKLKEEHESQI